MTANTIIDLWAAMEEFMKENGHNMESIKQENPFSDFYKSRRISDIKKAASNGEYLSLNVEKVKGLLGFLEVPYQQHGKVILTGNQFIQCKIQ